MVTQESSNRVMFRRALSALGLALILGLCLAGTAPALADTTPQVPAVASNLTDKDLLNPPPRPKILYPGNPDSTYTIDQWLECGNLLGLLLSHEYDGFYLGTPYYGLVGSSNPPWGNMRPRGIYGSSAGMNCTGFVARAFYDAGANLDYLDSDGSGSYVNACNWYNTVYRHGLKCYRFYSKEEALASGLMKKGDVIYWEPRNWGMYGADCHIGIFWGDTSDEDLWWHQVETNEISELYPGIDNSELYVFPIQDRHAGWNNFSGTWSYLTDTNTFATGWLYTADNYYYFDAAGTMITGWKWVNGSCYYLYPDGHMAADEIIDGSYVDSSGAWIPERWEYDHAWKYRYGNGTYATGWQQINGTWYFFNQDGIMAADQMVGTYYVDASGAWIPDAWHQNSTGWWYRYGNGTYPADTFTEIAGTTYYFDASGYMLTGWQYILAPAGEGTASVNNWYYFYGSGGMATGWEYLNGHYFFLDRTTGVMATGLVRDINGADYLFADWGGMYYGWCQAVNPSTGFTEFVYCTDTGALAKNTWEGWYYLGPDGFMLRDSTTPDGLFVDENGRWISDAITS